MLDRDSVKAWAAIGEYSSLGIQMVGTIAVCAGLGWYMDRAWSTKPWGLLLGALFGATGGMIAFIRAVLKANRDSEQEKKRD